MRWKLQPPQEDLSDVLQKIAIFTPCHDVIGDMVPSCCKGPPKQLEINQNTKINIESLSLKNRFISRLHDYSRSSTLAMTIWCKFFQKNEIFCLRRFWSIIAPTNPLTKRRTARLVFPPATFCHYTMMNQRIVLHCRWIKNLMEVEPTFICSTRPLFHQQQVPWLVFGEINSCMEAVLSHLGYGTLLLPPVCFKNFHLGFTFLV